MSFVFETGIENKIMSELPIPETGLHFAISFYTTQRMTFKKMISVFKLMKEKIQKLLVLRIKLLPHLNHYHILY